MFYPTTTKKCLPKKNLCLCVTSHFYLSTYVLAPYVCMFWHVVTSLTSTMFWHLVTSLKSTTLIVAWRRARRCSYMLCSVSVWWWSGESWRKLLLCHEASPYNKTSDVFSPEYKANTSRRIDFSADVITNKSSNIRLNTAFAMHIVGIFPNITQFTVLTYWLTYLGQIFDVFL